MARPKECSDEDILMHLEDFWSMECEQRSRSLTFASFSDYLKKKGIEIKGNSLRARPKVHDRLLELKREGSISHGAAPAHEDGATQASEELASLKARYQSLRLRVSRAFTREACRKILAEDEKMDTSSLLTKEGEGFIITAKDKVFENPMLQALADEFKG
jgi:hypothetical protein